MIFSLENSMILSWYYHDIYHWYRLYHWYFRANPEQNCSYWLLWSL